MVKKLSPSSFEMVKKASFLALVLECICERKNLDARKLFGKLKAVQRIWNLNNEDTGLQELTRKERKDRDVICKEKIMEILKEVSVEDE